MTLSKFNVRRPALMATASCVILPLALGMMGEHAHAQAIDDIVQTATQHGISAWSYFLNAFCWVIGSILLLMCGMGWYQHQRNPNAGTRPGMLVAAGIIGGVMLAFPFMAKTASYTIFGVAPTVTGDQAQMKFDK